MPDPSSLRDSTQIVLPSETLDDGVREDIETEFTVTILDASPETRIIGSPVEIKAVNEFLVRHGVSLP